MEYRWVSKDQPSKLNGLKPPGMKNAMKASSQGETVPEGLSASVGRHRPPSLS